MRRIQRKRTKGWRMPDGAVYVGRPSRWGNPFTVEAFMGGWSVDGPAGHLDVYEDRDSAFQRAVDEFRSAMRLGAAAFGGPVRDRLLQPLRGRDLVCWCPLDQPCHADVLLELAQ